MKLAILTQYFPPETGAPQNRLYELAQRLLKEGIEITVLTAMPNYPQMKVFNEYIGKKYVYEDMEGIKVHRTGIYVSQSRSVVSRLLNYFSFVWTSYWTGRRKLDTYDFLLVESPPLFLGISGWLLSKKCKAKMIFNVSDLWPESAEKLNIINNRFFLWIAYKLEAFLYKKSTLVTGQTQGIVNSIKTRFPDKSVYWLPNGVDINLYNPLNYNRDWRKKQGFEENHIVVLYAGLLGYAQGLNVIIEAADYLKDNQTIRFVILGNGPERDQLIQRANQLNLKNILFLESVPRNEMPYVISASDIALIPLKKLDLFKGAIPSKIFENASMEKPLVLGVEGEAYELFIEKGNAGLFYEPENHVELAKAILKLTENKDLRLQTGKNGRIFVNEYFNRDKIAAGLINQLQMHSS